MIGKGVRVAHALLTSALLTPALLMPALAAPPPGADWDWQLSEAVLNVEEVIASGVKAFDADPDNVTREQIMALNEAGVYTICYVSVGTMEDWRDDAAQFSDLQLYPNPVVGNAYEEWPGEFFLDIRQPTLRYVMQRRFNDCRLKGFQAVEADNMDIYANDSGFDISAIDAVRYGAQLARDAHAQGLEIGQKNAPELTGKLAVLFDFVITESCFADGFCDQVLPYVVLGKPVFNAEYTDTDVDFSAACSFARQQGISMILKERDLGAGRRNCQ